MDGFDLACLWVGRIVICGSAAFVALCFVALLVFKVVEHAIRAYRPNRSLLDISRERRDILVKAIPPRPPPKKG